MKHAACFIQILTGIIPPPKKLWNYLHENQHFYLLRFYEQRKYISKTKQGLTHGCTTKQLGLLTIGRDMHIVLKKRSCFNFVCTRQIYIHVSWSILKSLLLSCVSILLVSPNPRIHCPQQATLFLSLRENNFDIFSLGLIPYTV